MIFFVDLRTLQSLNLVERELTEEIRCPALRVKHFHGLKEKSQSLQTKHGLAELNRRCYNHAKIVRPR